MDGWLIVFLVYFLISIIYILARSDSKEECKTNFPALKETQAECLEAYPTTCPTTVPITESQCKTTFSVLIETKDECKTKFPELIETKDDCLENYPTDLMEISQCNSGGMPFCPADSKSRPLSCNDATTEEARPITEATCVQGYHAPDPNFNWAYKCKWNVGYAGSDAACDTWHWNEGVMEVERCRITQ